MKNYFTTEKTPNEKRGTLHEYNFAVIGKPNYEASLNAWSDENQKNSGVTNVKQFQEMYAEKCKTPISERPFTVLQYCGKLENAQKALGKFSFYLQVQIVPTIKITK
jgi:hypothetical protein